MKTRKEFIKRKITKRSKSLDIFNEICPDFYSIKYKNPSDFVSKIWNDYQTKIVAKQKKANNAVNGKIFEYILIALLIREEVLPFYYQAEITYVPNVQFDFFIYTEENPITLSVKTTLRERYKQAVLEADSMVSVHRNSYNCIISMDTGALHTIEQKMMKKEILSLAKAIDVFSLEFDKLIWRIKSQGAIPAPSFNVVQNKQVMIEKSLK